jgi:hypothetical protein
VKENIAFEKIVGCTQNREMRNYRKLLYKKRGKWEYCARKFGKEKVSNMINN